MTTPTETCRDAEPDEAESPPHQLLGHRPYHSKRPHKKSRAGCKNCKSRKVKCDEARPTCKHCQLRKEVCAYPAGARLPALSSSSASASASSHGLPPSRSASPADTAIPVGASSSAVSLRTHDRSAAQDRQSLVDPGMISLVSEPMFLPGDADVVDMRLLWLYTTTTHLSFSPNSGKMRVIDDILKVKIVQYAFQSPFLMDCILGLSALHLQHISDGSNVEVPRAKSLAYRARAFQGYRRAIEGGRREDFPALLACSLLLCALSSDALRDDSTKPFYIIDWMVVWRGIGLIIEMITPAAMFESGLEPLFFRPRIDLNASALHIPPNLLFMVSSIGEDDPEYQYVEVYYETLKYLGSLYKELVEGFGPLFDLRVIVWFTFLPKDFVELAKKLRPRALVIIAHYLVFTKVLEHPWWMHGISDRELQNMWRFLGEEWYTVLRAPVGAIGLSDRTALAKLLLDNHSWEPPPGHDYEGSVDPRTTLLSFVDDVGKEVVYAGQFHYKLPTRAKPVWNIKPSESPSPEHDSSSSSADSTPSPS